jgi:hypothetical protein
MAEGVVSSLGVRGSTVSKYERAAFVVPTS